jgi:hypothetical protein
MHPQAELCEFPAVQSPPCDVNAPVLEAPRAGQQGSPFTLPDGTKLNRAPQDMRSWEILSTYRLAWHFACFLPTTRLAQALADWLCMAQHELEQRGEWRPEALPPQSM